MENKIKKARKVIIKTRTLITEDDIIHKPDNEYIKKFVNTIKLLHNMNKDEDAMQWAMINLRGTRFITNAKRKTNLKSIRAIFLHSFRIKIDDVIILHMFAMREKNHYSNLLRLLLQKTSIDSKTQATNIFLTTWSYIQEGIKLDIILQNAMEMIISERVSMKQGLSVCKLEEVITKHKGIKAD